MSNTPPSNHDLLSKSVGTCPSMAVSNLAASMAGKSSKELILETVRHNVAGDLPWLWLFRIGLACEVVWGRRPKPTVFKGKVKGHTEPPKFLVKIFPAKSDSSTISMAI